MEVAKTIGDIRAFVHQEKKKGHTIGLVPTMGALHSGHLDLMRLAASKCDKVVVSIFVNPTQFAPGEDFEGYPRKIEADLEKCRLAGVAAVFCPERVEVYGGHNFITLHVDQLGDHLCGASRPGHFDGVIQIVNKLFNIVKPDLAVFGQKDIQQFRILEQMADEFNHDIQIIMASTVRAADGLALSSRNIYLTGEERVIAPTLFTALQDMSRKVMSLKQDVPAHDSLQTLCKQAGERLDAAGFRTDYVQLVSYEDLQPPARLAPGKTYVIAGAAYLGKARLIDNVILKL